MITVNLDNSEYAASTHSVSVSKHYCCSHTIGIFSRYPFIRPNSPTTFTLQLWSD